MAQALLPDRPKLPLPWRAALGHGAHLFLDFDGTLVDLQPRPDLVDLSMDTQLTLERLLGHERVKICIVTGRDLADIRRHIDVPGLGFIASHGLETWRDGTYWSHPIVQETQPLLEALRRQWLDAAEYDRAVLVEAKTATLALHLRGLDLDKADRLRQRFHRLAAAHSDSLAVLSGKMLLEIRPKVSWTKGEAIASWMADPPGDKAGLALFAGDDETDEEAFQRLQGDWQTIHVGARPDTRARYMLPTPAAMRRLLSVLLEILEET